MLILMGRIGVKVFVEKVGLFVFFHFGHDSWIVLVKG